MTGKLQRVAHRGGSHLAPQNTLAAFRNALTLPVDAIELDVHVSRDGQLVVIHDNTVEKLTDGEGNILDLDFAYLRSLNAAAHFPGGWPQPQQIPMLREVLDLVRGRLQVYIEIKSSKRDGQHGRYPNIAKKVVNEVRTTGMLNQVLIISFDWPVLRSIKSLEPHMRTGALVSREVWTPEAEHALDDLFEQTAALRCDWLNIDHKLYSAGRVDVVHAHGFKLGLWTVNSLDEMRMLADAGVDSLTTDRPDLFAQL